MVQLRNLLRFGQALGDSPPNFSLASLLVSHEEKKNKENNGSVCFACKLMLYPMIPLF